MSPRWLDVTCPKCEGNGFIQRISGEWLRAKRLSMKVSLREMARRLGVSPAYVCDVEKDRRNAPEQWLEEYMP